MPKKLINIRLRPDQEERIHAIVERSAVLDTSKFMRIAVDWLLMSDIGEVLKKIVDAEKFPDYQLPKKTPAGKSGRDEDRHSPPQQSPQARCCCPLVTANDAPGLA